MWTELQTTPRFHVTASGACCLQAARTAGTRLALLLMVCLEWSCRHARSGKGNTHPGKPREYFSQRNHFIWSSQSSCPREIHKINFKKMRLATKNQNFTGCQRQGLKSRHYKLHPPCRFFILRVL